jgi:CBS domain-containing protein
MARCVREIMNSELFSVDVDANRKAVLDALLEFGVTAVPVLDEGRRPVGMTTIRDIVDETRPFTISRPAKTVSMKASVDDAARMMLEAGTHHLVVVGSDGRAAGMVSSLDLLRALLGAPPAHPATFPHHDTELDVFWTDARTFDADSAATAPAGPGVLVISAGGVGRMESDLWVEPSASIRARLVDMLELPQDDALALKRILARRDLRFRCTEVADPRRRETVVRRLRERLEAAPLPRDLTPTKDEITR